MKASKRNTRKLLGEFLLALACGIFGGTIDIIFCHPDFNYVIILAIVTGIITILRKVIRRINDWIEWEC